MSSRVPATASGLKTDTNMGVQTSLPYVLAHPAQREEANPTHTHTEGIKRLTLAAQQAVITLGEKTYKQGEVEHVSRPASSQASPSVSSQLRLTVQTQTD